MPMYRVSKKTHFQNATEPTVHWHNHQLANTPYVWKSIFWSFLTKTKQDQALPSHVHGKIWPHSAQFWLWFFSISTFFLGHPVYNYNTSCRKEKRLLRESKELEHSRGETHYAPWGRAGVVIKVYADDENDIIIVFGSKYITISQSC